MNRDAQKYYALTEQTYRLLHEPETPYMNLGLWPAQDLLQAQSALVRLTAQRLLDLTQDASACPLSILELGSGWGGSRAILQDLFPAAVYQGINLSQKQIDFAAAYNKDVPNTQYLCSYFEQLEALPLAPAPVAIGVESILHVADKAELFRKLRALGVRYFSFAEICLHANRKAEQYFQPALTYAWDEEQYRSLLANTCDVFRIENLSHQVFAGWADYLAQINELGFRGNRRVLRQFQQGYRAIADLSRTGEVSYCILSGAFRD